MWTGDGTINAAATRAAGWDGAILVLPGGTLNLLSKALHGDRPAPEILADALQGKVRRSPIPTIVSNAGTAFITVVAGPATRWAEVPDGTGVRIGTDGKAYPAVILTPTPGGIRADGILTEGTGDVLRHGLAWLGGDFRDGPSEPIVTGATVVLESDKPISLEFDGEMADMASPAKFSLGSSAVDFLATA